MEIYFEESFFCPYCKEEISSVGITESIEQDGYPNLKGFNEKYSSQTEKNKK